MKKVTLTLGEDVARWARFEATQRGTSLSQIVDEILRERMRSEDAYEEARRRFFEVEPRSLRSNDRPLPSRDEIRDRSGLR